MNTKLFANKINEFFVSLADRFTPLTRDSPPSLVLQELFVSNEEVFWSLSDIHNFSMDHNMILNSIKCKEMLINLMWYPNFTLEPLVVGNNAIECVSIYKILGVFIDSNVKWNSHVDYIYKKACKKLYSVRILRRAGADQGSMLKVYISSVRPALEYAVPVWQSIPGYPSDKIESIQKRGLKIIFQCMPSSLHGLRPLRVREIRYVRSTCAKWRT